MKTKYYSQLLSTAYTIFTFLVLTLSLFIFIKALDLFPFKSKLIPVLRFGDVAVGLTIYLKTSVDFAIFIARLMSKQKGFSKQLSMQIGTSIGNWLGTLVVLTIWTFFKEIKILLVIMIFIASVVLLKMAEDGFKELSLQNPFFKLLAKINLLFSFITKLFLPKINPSLSGNFSPNRLFLFSLSIPFILGLDDFAGYIPLFSVVNVFGFATGVLLGHALLLLFLFASPMRTISFVKKPLVAFLGNSAFVAIAFFGFYEILRLLLRQ